MSLFVMGDLHLSVGVPEKSMEIFSGWENYQSKIEQNWKNCIQPEDVIILAGDISWGMSLEEAKPDFAFINNLPGKKIILKGNHDYWWNSMKKMMNFFQENSFDTLYILHNNCYAYENYGICGTRGWVNMPGEEADVKVMTREQQRLRVSLQAAKNQNLIPMAFLHYPPVFASNRNELMLAVLHEFEVKDCYYGHLHGKIHAKAVQGQKEDINYHLISGDYLKFMPEKNL